MTLFKSFTLCDRQVRVSPGGAYALDWNVVIRVAEAKGIIINDTFFTLLAGFEQTFIEEINSGDVSD